MADSGEGGFQVGDAVWVSPESRSIQRDFGRRFRATVKQVNADSGIASVEALNPPETVGVGLHVLEHRDTGQ